MNACPCFLESPHAPSYNNDNPKNNNNNNNIRKKEREAAKVVRLDFIKLLDLRLK